MNRRTDVARGSYRRHWLLTALLLGLTMFGVTAEAGYPKTPQDFKRLPRYCAARLLETEFPKAEHDLWARRIGPDFLHIHHYCAAQQTLWQANNATTESDRIMLLRAVVTEINYIEVHTKPTFFMRAETGVQKGRVLLRLNEIPAAIKAFNSSLKVNPRYPAAYAGIADAYLMLKQPAKAKMVLERGIKAVPNSKNLRMRRAALK